MEKTKMKKYLFMFEYHFGNQIAIVLKTDCIFKNEMPL
jgi:hypothetical protein